MPTEPNPEIVRLGTLLTVAEEIQAFGLARKTGEIRVTNVPPPARLGIVDGQVVDAQFGTLTGLEAAVALINLDGPQTEFVIGRKPLHQTIDLPNVQILIAAATAKDEQAARQMAQQPPIVPPTKPMLQVILGSEMRIYPLPQGVSRIGRTDINDIVIPEDTVSERHAAIDSTQDGITLRDLGSRNGTFVDGQRVTECRLSGRMTIRFGLAKAVFVDANAR